MLSILIPVYNYDVGKLVSDLLSQIELINCEIELILLDDGSDSAWQAQYLAWSNLLPVRIHKNSSNKGRVASRKRLVELSKYDNLLFMDCDAEVVDGNYLNNCIKKLGSAQVVCGGHVYQETKPSPEFILHWRYGREVEVRPLIDRIKKPYHSFSTFNFYCKKSVFNNYLNDIEVKGYGHEDTLMGHVLLKNSVPISHIDNPLMHVGLKENGKFLSDTKSAINNALEIQKTISDIDIKLLKKISLIKTTGMGGVVCWILGLNQKSRELNLKSNNPSIRSLQLFKLQYALCLASDA